MDLRTLDTTACKNGELLLDLFLDDLLNLLDLLDLRNLLDLLDLRNLLALLDLPPSLRVFSPLDDLAEDNDVPNCATATGTPQ